MLYSYSKPKSLFRKITLGIIIAAGVYSISQATFFNILYVYVAIVLFSAEGFQLDTDTMCFRKTTVFWKWHYGKWIPLSEPLYVIVIRAKDTSVDTANNPNDLVIRLFLKTTSITVSSTADYQIALRIANEIATKLEIPFHNKTTDNVI